MNHVSELSIRGGVPWKISGSGRTRSAVEGICEGVNIRVIIDNKTQNIVTGYPIPYK
jgi:hypothetical protein